MLAGRRPDAGPHDPRIVPPAIRHRRDRRLRPRPMPRPTRSAGRRGVTDERVDVAIVGGGPAGAVLATRLARAGVAVTVLERSATWAWRAGGVFASPAAAVALERAGLDRATLAAVARPIPAMRVETQGGTAFRLTYGTETGGRPAVGFDRSRLDPALLDLARSAGADVRLGLARRGGRHRGATARGSGPGRGRPPPARHGRRRCRWSALGRRARGRRRSSRPARTADRADVPPRGHGTRPATATRGCGSCATAMSGSRRSPAAG